MLSDAVKEALSDTFAQKFVSAVSAYEIMYKHRIGKLCGLEDITGNFMVAPS